MTKEKPRAEILAPAGSTEQLIAAVNNGCDSVYLGLDSFNARMKAPNFTADNIGQWIDYCHLFGVKVYVAINTSLKNCEFVQAVKLLQAVYQNNADGVIVTDLALMRIASTLPKPFDVVASTQLNAHDSYGAQLLLDCGATTVVCARESSIDEVRDIASTGVNVECFIHGATCVCQSGQCLFSSMVGGNSGNRGLCAQPCRKLYSANGQDKFYLLSARDLCGLDIAKRLHECGVSTYKIEGRNRRAEYAGITSRIYRNLFDNNFQYNKSDVDALAEMYNRSMSDLSYLGGGNNEIIAQYAQSHIGVKVGEVKGRGFVAQVEVSKGDGLKVFDGNKEVCGGVALESGSGYINADFNGSVRDGMEVRRTTSVKLCDEVLSTKKKLPICVTFTAYPDNVALLKANCSGVEVCVKSDFAVQKAVSSPTSESEIAAQLQKSGNSHYTITDITIEKGDIFLAKSQINGLRRQVFEALDKAVVNHYNKQYSNRATAQSLFYDILISLNCVQSTTERRARREQLKQERKQFADTLAVICYSMEQLQQAKDKCQYLIYKPEYINAKALSEAGAYDAFIDLPAFSDNKYLRDLFKNEKVGVVCHNVGQVGLARVLGLPYIAGSGLNIYNDFIAREFIDAQTFVYSLELTLHEISEFRAQHGLVFVDGNITLMKLVHCPYKLNYKCNCSTCQASKPLIYTDELGNNFNIIRRRDGRCTFELQNGKKLSVISKLKSGGRYLIDFNQQVIDHYLSLNNGTDDGYVETAAYTKGRLFNKVN